LKPKLLKILIILAIIFVAGYLIFQASTTVVNPYIPISDLKNNPEAYYGREIQVIGNVTGPLTGDSKSLKFTLKDEQDDIIVSYKGPIPQNFMEGINVVVIGELDTNGQLIANQILTKCPSKYDT
jgi:cytochrome c-type biogenesis protein CcmE